MSQRGPFSPDFQLCKLCNLSDDWLKPMSLTNHPADYIIRRLIQELKIRWIRPIEVYKIGIFQERKLLFLMPNIYTEILNAENREIIK